MDHYLYLPKSRIVLGPFASEIEAESHRSAPEDVYMLAPRYRLSLQAKMAPRCPTCGRPPLPPEAEEV